MVLHRLPTELLYSIFDALSDTDLYTLLIASRHLHAISLPLYLSRHGIPKPTDLPTGTLAIRGAAFLALPALRISPQLTSLHTLSCTFPHDVKCAGGLARQIASTTRLVSRCTAVHEVVLDLVNLTGRKDTEFEPWSLALEELLRVVVVGKRCAALTVRRGRSVVDITYFQQTLQERKRVTVPSLINPPMNIMKRAVDVMTRTRLPNSKSLEEDPALTQLQLLPPSPPQTLTSFHIASPLLLSPPFSPWTLLVIHTSPLTHLSLSDPSQPPATWAALLPLLSIPTLSSLSIRTSTVPFAPLASFLARHPRLTALDLGRALPRPPSRVLPLSSLRQLTALTAAPEYIVHLLKPPDALPKLSRLTVSTHLGLGAHFSFAALARALAPAAHRIRWTTLALEIYVDADSPEWMALGARDAGGGGLGGAPQCASRVEVTAGQFVRATAAGGALFPRWLALFPMVRDVAFFEWEFVRGREERIAFVRSFAGVCDSVKRVRIDDEEKSVGDWVHYY